MISTRLKRAIYKARNYPSIVKVGVFGSRARDEELPESDVDILIDYDNNSAEYLDNLDYFMEDVERLIYNHKIDWVTVPGLMGSSNEEFRNEVLNDVIWIYEDK